MVVTMDLLRNAEELSNYLLTIYENARNLPPNKYHQWLQGSLRPYMTYDSALWSLMDEDGAVVGASLLDVHPSLVTNYFEVALQTDEQLVFLDEIKRRQGKTVLINDVMTVDEFHQTDLFREFSLPMEVPNNIGFAQSLYDGSTITAFMHLARKSISDTFVYEDSKLTDEILPHWGIASHFNMTKKSTVTSLSDQFCICSAGGEILFSHKRFWQAIEYEWGKKHFLPSFDYLDYKNANNKMLYSGKHLELRISSCGPVFLCKASLLPKIQPEKIDNLTDREKEIACYFSRGHSYKEIADILGISKKTVDNHARSIRDKLVINSMSQLARFFL